MAPIINVVKEHQQGETSKSILQKLRNSQKQLVREAMKIIKEGENIISYSYSSTLLDIFSRIKKIVIWLPDEIHSKRLAKKLTKNNIKVKIFNISEKLPSANKVIISCDAYCEDGSAINASGTLSLLKKSHAKNIPTYCFASNIKKIQRSKIELILKSLPNNFEFIPKKYIDYLITA